MDCPTCGKSLSTKQGMRQHHTKVHGEALDNRICKGCEGEFYDPKARKKYCEKCDSNVGKHNGNYQNATETTKCEVCGDNFEYYPSNKDGRYCESCLGATDGLLPENPAESDERIETECPNCHAVSKVLESRLEQNKYGIFCDLSCYGDWLSENIVGENHHQWEGGSIAYGQDWWQLRRAALERDDYKCQRCGSNADEIGRNPDVHHIEPVRSYDDPSNAHRLDNVICLCRSCHRHVEQNEGEHQL